MATIYEKCDEDAPQSKAIAAMMHKYHVDLEKAGVTVECLLATNPDGSPVKHHGWPCYAKIKIMSLEQRVAGSADARMVIDLDRWSDLHENQRNALVDHELEHLELVLDKLKKPKRDDIDRPKLRIKPHDYELTGFDSVIRRHEDAAIEVANYRKFEMTDGCQMLLEFAGKVG